ncbi:pectate lyase [Pseudoalteromonas fuliginea]|uniref:Pectate lyase n=2 Tax=Pseudoalteromonas TaxID=53246 RepID=A0AB73BFN7_9GAMM|nr:pectinesterase family protein [Pseudoalteromonas fuliginea]KAA1159505.1 pectate lyase [Pseudoalteromonas fuliginea]
MKTKISVITTLLLSTILTGCQEESSINVKEAPAPAIQGTFVDSPVAGLSYTSLSVPDGVTDANGQFNYFRGEAITFAIGDIAFPSIAASNILSPLNLFSTDTVFHPAVVNSLRLFQSLDSDGDVSNGITISATAADAATINLSEGQTITDYFSRSEDEFAADVNVWLANAGTPTTELIDADQAILHFVDFVYKQYNSTQPNAFNLSLFTGDVYNPLVKGSTAGIEILNFSPADDTNSTGTFTRTADGEIIGNGNYEFIFGDRVLAFTTAVNGESNTQYLISRSFNTVDSVYSLCHQSDDASLSDMIAKCDSNDDAKNNVIVFSEEQAAIELENLNNLAEQNSKALIEDFNTTTEDFFKSTYKSVSDEIGSAALYFKTGGSLELDAENGNIVLEGDRFSIGNTLPGKETSPSDTLGKGIYNLSEGFTISFDVIAHNDAGTLSLYVDNNTTGQDNSVHGKASKFYSKAITAENLPQGQRFTYTYKPGEDVVTGPDLDSESAQGVLNAEIKNSFLQIRTDSAASITLDNLELITVATDVPEIEEPTDPTTPPTGGDTTTPFPFVTDFTTVTGDLFSTDFSAITAADGSIVPMFKKTGGSVSVIDTGLEINSGRFTMGNTTPNVETTETDQSTTGSFDLSRPYQILIDIVSVSDPDGDNNFQIYVDNNTSSSSKSIHGSSSKFYNELINTLVPDTTLVVEGKIATATSFLQLRTENGGTVVIKNLRIEYLDDPSVFKCNSSPELYFCDDFSAGDLSNWKIIAKPDNTAGAVGEFDILDLSGNNVMRYTAGGVGGELILATEDALQNVPDTGNYFFEADIRPRQNSTTASKQLYLMARYESEGNWLAGGLNVQNSTSSTQVEVAVTVDGSISRPIQAKSPILLGEKGGTTDGVWYTTRFEMIDSELTAYLNGEKMGTISDSTYSARGLIGLFTNNRSFELDNVKVGDPSIKPIQLTLDYKDPAWDASTTTDPLIINVTAIKNDGVTPDTFSVTSSNKDVVSADVSGDVVTLSPLSAGEATIKFVSGSDETIIRTIEVNVVEGFVMPSTDYGDLSGKLMPEKSANNQFVDTLISIDFDTTDVTPTLGSLGEVRIYKQSDDTLVDTLKVGKNIDVIGYPGQDRIRAVNYFPISLEDNTLIIKPRNSVLEYGQTYRVVIGDDVVTGAKLNDMNFAGLGNNSQWTFTTKVNTPAGNELLVDDNDVADFRTVQGALNFAMQHLDKDEQTTVSIKDGTYNELLFLRNKNNITLQGESQNNTIIQYENYETLNSGSGGSAALGGGTPNGGRSVFLVEGTDMLVINNLTLKNTHIRSNSVSNQAETIYFNSQYRLVANNANFISEQDTLLLKGYTWFYNTLVAGNVDFIWGYPVTSLFEDSEIRTLGDSKNGDPTQDTKGGYVLQARVPVETDPGFIFLNNEFTNGPGPIGNGVLDNSTYLARSSGSSSYFDNVTLINNKFDTHIATVGWAVQGVENQPAPNPEAPSATSGWREYGSMDMQGNALDLSTRNGGYILQTSEVAQLLERDSIFAIYGDGAGWTPTPLPVPVLPDEPVKVIPVNVNLGFAGYNFDVTGGTNGTVVTVDNGSSLKAALSEAKATSTPIIIYVDGVITDANSGGDGLSIQIKDMDNVSIVGVADRGHLDGIGIEIRRANNIIIQNLKINQVLTGGKDGISIEGDENGSTSNIWIDHNELYSSLDSDQDFYDGLIDSKSGAQNITISYNYLHDSWKTSLHGHSDDDTSTNKNRFITFHHNRFENIVSRVPLFRFGRGHVFNNYYNNITSSAINSRMGAELQIEGNYFENTKNPVISFYSDTIGYWNTSGNYLSDTVTWGEVPDGDVAGEVTENGITPTSSYQVPYEYTLTPVMAIKDHVIAHAGIGKIDQSDLDIPTIEEPTEPPTQEPLGLPFTENFSANNADEFFSNRYRDLSGLAGSNTPLFHRVTGSVQVSNGKLTMTGTRISIANTTPTINTTGDDTQTSGLLDLSNNYQVTFKVDAVSGNTAKSFQIYVDNNTSGSANSIHNGSSKFYSIKLEELVLGQTYTVDGFVATPTSFITIRTESEATITIDELTIQ